MDIGETGGSCYWFLKESYPINICTTVKLILLKQLKFSVATGCNWSYMSVRFLLIASWMSLCMGKADADFTRPFF